MFDDEIKEVFNAVNKNKNILITATADADGDSVGASLALYNILYQRFSNDEKNIKIVTETKCPKRYSFLPDSDKFFTPEELETKKFDVGFVLDGGSERAGNVETIFDNCKVTVLVDHHKFGSKKEYDIRLWDPNISSTSEIVYQLTEHELFKTNVDINIASQLYAGLAFDTGIFRHSNTTYKTLNIVSKLISTGIEFSTIIQKSMLDRSFEGQKLLGEVLSNMELAANKCFCWSVVTMDMMSKTGATDDDMEGIINIMSSIDTVTVSMILKEYEKGAYKISFRSKNKFDVGKLSRDLDPNGGGHQKAAGCKISGNIDEIVVDIIAKVGEGLKESCF